MAKAADWNTIIVGSSPLLLIEAIYLARTGRKVLVLEKMGRFGGAWGGLDTKEFPNLEVGCHYWDISRRAYNFLHSNLGINLVPFSPQPQFAYRNIFFPYDFKQTIRVLRELKKVIQGRSIGSFVSNMLREEYYRPRVFPFTKKFLFPPLRFILPFMGKSHFGCNKISLSNSRVLSPWIPQPQSKIF